MIPHVCSSSINIDYEYWGAYGTVVSGVTTTTNTTSAQSDFGGVANTDAIVKNVKSSDGLFTQSPWSAAGLCRQHTFPNGTKGYLGAAGEWKLVRDIILKIDELLYMIGCNKIQTEYQGNYWTSTQYNGSYAWYINLYNQNCTSNDKDVPVRVRAFCTLDNPGLKIITFYLDGKALTAEKGMTWREYISSGFNQYPYKFEDYNGIVIVYDYVIDYKNNIMLGDMSRYISIDELIIEGQIYTY